VLKQFHYLNYLADAEISYLHCTRASNQQIVRFDIPMHYILFNTRRKVHYRRDICILKGNAHTASIKHLDKIKENTKLIHINSIESHSCNKNYNVNSHNFHRIPFMWQSSRNQCKDKYCLLGLSSCLSVIFSFLGKAHI
jgi:hypothetical protein